MKYLSKNRIKTGGRGWGWKPNNSVIKIEIKTLSNPGPGFLICNEEGLCGNEQGKQVTWRMRIECSSEQLGWSIRQLGGQGTSGASKGVRRGTEKGGRWDPWSVRDPRGRADSCRERNDGVRARMQSCSAAPLGVLAVGCLRLHVPWEQSCLCQLPHRQVSSRRPLCCHVPELGQKSNRICGWINDAFRCLIPVCFLGFFS